VAAGGTLANLIFGGLFWVAARALKQSASWRYFFWLLMTFNLFDAGGYFLFSGIANIGDWAAVVAGWQPAWAWRIALIALGTETYFFLFLPVCLRELLPFVGTKAEVRVRRARQFTLAPYLTCGILSCVAGTLNPVAVPKILTHLIPEILSHPRIVISGRTSPYYASPVPVPVEAEGEEDVDNVEASRSGDSVEGGPQ
jgi:hypothetical protein